MTESTRRGRSAMAASALLLVLAITTGWVQAASPPADGNTAAASSAIAPLVTQRSNAAAGRPEADARTAGDRALFLARLLTERAGEPQQRRVHAKVPQPAAGAYGGRNHFWIPSLGISYPVHLFECTRKREPDHLMYRWGCAGANNVYILGHASSVMKPLHDAFEAGRLRVGMAALYADRNGRIRVYRVTEWRVVDPVDSAWAIASQSVPSMTLQTCVGRNGVDRLNVRLVAEN